MSHVFISYSKTDREYARKLADKLLAEGFDVWIDRDRIESGNKWWSEIVYGIRECSAFLVVMTPEAGQSRWVEREVMLADDLQKPMFPMLLKGDLHSCELWTLFINRQYEDVRNHLLPNEDFYKRLAKHENQRELPGKEIAPQYHAVSRSLISTATLSVSEESNIESAASPPLILPDVSSILPPPFEWCEIPTGKVTIEYSETNHRMYNVPAFAMAKYPVTNAQYQVFLDAEDGYRDLAWWEFSVVAKRWRRNNPTPPGTNYVGHDLPRTQVTWFEGVAFCQWLSAKIAGVPSFAPTVIVLATEQHWQRAAEGDDKRIYPWGDKFVQEYCNSSESNIGNPTPVTKYLRGSSPFGVVDTVGNVFEWCLTEYATGSNYSLDGMVSRVVRGSSFEQSGEFFQLGDRYYRFPDSALYDTGFRIAGSFNNWRTIYPTEEVDQVPKSKSRPFGSV